MVAIHIPSPALTLRAGRSAIEHIRQNGLQPADVHMIPGAAGGPKALGIQGLDLALFGDWLPRANQPRSLIGASIGSWRFAAACLPDPVAGLKRLGELYTAQRFPRGITVAEISLRCGVMLDDLLGDEFDQLLSNPLYHLNVVVVRSLGLLQHDSRSRLGLGLGGVIGANLLGRRFLKRYFERVILHELALAEREAQGRRVAASLLYGRVVEHLDVGMAEFQRVLARLAGRDARGAQNVGVTKPRAGRANR